MTSDDALCCKPPHQQTSCRPVWLSYIKPPADQYGFYTYSLSEVLLVSCGIQTSCEEADVTRAVKYRPLSFDPNALTLVLPSSAYILARPAIYAHRGAAG